MAVNNQLFWCQLLEVHTSVADGQECVVQRIIRLSSTSSWTYRPNPKHIDSKKMLFSLRKKNLSITSPLNRTSFLIFQKNSNRSFDEFFLFKEYTKDGRSKYMVRIKTRKWSSIWERLCCGGPLTEWHRRWFWNGIHTLLKDTLEQLTDSNVFKGGGITAHLFCFSFLFFF
jgi:hypothetical protein